MKNVIFLVIDSLNYTRIKQTNFKLTPFLKKLEEDYISCSNMYSQAPYTEAAVQSIYCGQNVLDFGGYIERYNKSPKTIFEAYCESGFDVYYNSFQPQCFPSSLRRGVTDIFCNVGYDWQALWHYRLEHYSNLSKLSFEDEKELIKIFDDNFPEWLRFLHNIETKDNEVSLIVDNAKSYNVNIALKLLEKEIKEYEDNKILYIKKLLKERENHKLFKIPHFFQDNKIKSKDDLKEIQDVLKPSFEKIKKLNRNLNFKNNKIPFSSIIKSGFNCIISPGSSSLKKFGKAILSVKNALFDPDLYDRFFDPGSSKNAPSLEKHMEHFYSWKAKHDLSKPFFACIHVDDVHSPEQFFTYDSTDILRIENQNKKINEYLDSLGRDYCGSITHDLSLIHIDNVIKEIFERFESDGTLNNTTIYIMADHGFAFSYNPIRTTFGIDFFLENYNIPCIIVDKSLGHKKISDLRSSKDIPFTALKLSGISIPSNFSGHSLLDDSGYDVLGIEYCGSGCPDLKRRELMFGAFDGKELVGIKKRLFDKNNSIKINEYYDLINDSSQKKNKKKSIIKNKQLIKYIDERIKNIKKYIES